MLTSALLTMMLMTPAAAGPLAPALGGQILCTAADPDHKTCMAIDTFKPMPDGTFLNTQEQRIAFMDGIISYTIALPAVIKGDAACWTMQRKHLQAARLKVTGPRLSPAQIAWLKKSGDESMVDFLNKEVCASFEETSEGLVWRVSVEGVRDSGLDQIVRWVDPSEGYHLVR